MPAPLSHHPEPRAPLTKDIAAAVRRIAPVAAFLLMALWSWRVADPIQALPNDPGRSPMGYGDVLEVTWGLQWYYDAVIARAHDLDLYPGIFAPDGWQVGTLAHGPGLFLAGLPWVALGGVALAYNASLWIAMVATYVGVYRLALRKLDWPWALAAAVFIAFWSYRWMRIGGQPNLLLGAAVLPWLAGCLEHGRSSSVRPWIAVVMGGALWAFAILCSLYFIWLGAVTIGAWGLGLWLHDPASRRRLGWSAVLMAAVALGLSSPYLFWFQQASARVGFTAFDIDQLATWGASANSLALPFARHPLSLAREVAAWAYHGPASEAGTISLGPVTCVLALCGLAAARRQRAWWPVVGLALIGMTLALGPFLRWDDRLVQLEHPVIQTVNGWIWSAGHALKPQLFATAIPPAPYDRVIPLPAVAPLILAPYWEGARVSARYALVGGVGVYLLAVWFVSLQNRRWARWALIGLMLVEWWPAPALGVPYPLEPHPAFAWIRDHTDANVIVADLYAVAPDRLQLRIKPQILTATLFHERAALSGTSSVLPAHAAAWEVWLADHPAPFSEPEFERRLRADQVGVLLLHVVNPETAAVAEALASQPDWQFVDCFEPAKAMTPWPYPICLVLP